MEVIIFLSYIFLSATGSSEYCVHGFSMLVFRGQISEKARFFISLFLLSLLLLSGVLFQRERKCVDLPGFSRVVELFLPAFIERFGDFLVRETGGPRYFAENWRFFEGNFCRFASATGPCLVRRRTSLMDHRAGLGASRRPVFTVGGDSSLPEHPYTLLAGHFPEKNSPPGAFCTLNLELPKG
jgi:hypothetical protein